MTHPCTGSAGCFAVVVGESGRLGHISLAVPFHSDGGLPLHGRLVCGQHRSCCCGGAGLLVVTEGLGEPGAEGSLTLLGALG